MLESTFKYPAVLRRMRVGPLAEVIDRVAGELVRLGYTHLTGRRYLSLLARFSRYAQRAGCRYAADVDRAGAETFLRRLRASSGTKSLARSALGHALRHLGQMAKRRFTRAEEHRERRLGTADERILSAFQSHLLEVRGLQPRSVDGIVLHARRLLAWYRSRCPRRALRDLGGEDVLAFVGCLARSCDAPGSRVAAVSHVRGLLRYLHGEGALRRDLAGVVPRVPAWQHAGVPRFLAWTNVRAVIDAIDSSKASGKRDRALLLLLATTGLRSQEVRRLELRDIDWRAAELHIRRTKVRRERIVPLVAEAGRALAEYVLHWRPSCSLPSVFLKHVAPIEPLRNSSTVSAIVLRRLKRHRHGAVHGGAHLFRHSLATQLVQEGQPIKEIADVLGHHHIDTTAIYIKVALPQLACVALPFPRA